MRRVSDVLQELIKSNGFLAFGLGKQLFNLTQLARFLQPYVEASAKKEVKKTALVMALSRLSQEISKVSSSLEDFQVESITAESGLVIFSYEKSARTIRSVQSFSEEVFRSEGFLTLTEGKHEVTLIFSKQLEKKLGDSISKKPLHVHRDVASLSIRFSPRYIRRPGFLYTVLQKLTFQGVNVLEVASTSTEFIVYLRDRDLQLAFATLQAGLSPESMRY